MVEKKEELWYEIPSTIYVPLGRRGQEAMSSDQCWLEGCNNTDQNELIPFEMEKTKSDVADDGSYDTCKKIKVKCNKCNGVFQFAIKEIYTRPKKEGKKEKDKQADGKPKVSSFMGMVYILDEEGNNIGFAGYC